MTYRNTSLVAVCATICVLGGACNDARREYEGISADIPTGSPAISTEGLVAAYDFETLTSDGRLRDFSGYDHHGEIIRTIATDGLFGQARLFDSVADRVHLPERDTLDLDGPLSIAVWVQVTTLDLHQHILACDDKYVLWVTPANQFRLGDTRGSGYSTPEGSVVPGEWYSVITVLHKTQGDTLHPGDVEIFVNGESAGASIVQRAQAADRPVAIWGSAELYPEDACYIGFESHQGDPAHQEMPFKGIVDEALVFARALTPEEVRAHATQPQR